VRHEHVTKTKLTLILTVAPTLSLLTLVNRTDPNSNSTRRPASADRTARRQFQAVFPVITGSFPNNIIAHLHGLSMDLTVGRTIGRAFRCTGDAHVVM